jgi:ribosomal subunit interface protein
MINISSRDFDITEAIREEITNMEASLYKHIPEEERIKVTLSKAAPDVFHVHMQAHYLGEDIISDHESHNFHKALELCKDHFVKQIDKRRDKVHSKGQKRG